MGTYSNQIRIECALYISYRWQNYLGLRSKQIIYTGYVFRSLISSPKPQNPMGTYSNQIRIECALYISYRWQNYLGLRSKQIIYTGYVFRSLISSITVPGWSRDDHVEFGDMVHHHKKRGAQLEETVREVVIVVV